MLTHEAEADPPEVEAWLAAQGGELAFDVGANVGRVAGDLASRFTRVVAWEPCAESYEQLVARAPANVTTMCEALSSAAGMVELVEQSRHIAKGQLTSPHTGGAEWASQTADKGGWGDIVGHRTVRCSTLDLAADVFGPPDLVKVDVEGHELDVVAGGMGVFLERRPAFYLEVHHDALGHWIDEELRPLYPAMRRIPHPGYAPHEFGAANHYWLVSG